MGLWQYWAKKMVELGPRNFYQKIGFCDYLPFYLYFLGGIELIWRELSQYISFSQEILFKLPATLADFATAYIIYLILKRKSENIALWASTLYLFNPAVFFNSSLWGQVDAVGALLLLASIYLLLKNHFILSGFFIGLSLTMKPIYFLALPILGLILWQKKVRKKNWWQECRPLRNFSAAALAGILLVSLPFSLTNPFGMLIERYQLAFSVYPFTSVNSFNFWAIGNRWWQSDLTRFWGLTYQYWGSLVVFLVLGLGLLLLWQKKREENIWLVLTTVFLVMFSFSTRTHERHIFTVFPFLTILAGLNVFYWLPLLILSIVSIANLYFALIWLIERGRFVFNWSLINFFSLTISLTSLAFMVSLFKKIKIDWRKIKRLATKNKIIILLLIFSLLVRFWQLGWPTRFYFDEVYHAFTATEMAKGNVAAWEWWNTPPKGMAYEWTHPPLAKLFMTVGVLIFGEAAFAWRFFGALFGIGCVFLVYLLGKKLFNQKVALFASFLFAFDGLPLVMSRIGMNDIYLLFFTLLTLWLFLRENYSIAGLTFGLALSSKWTAVYLLPVLGVWWLLKFFQQKKNKRFEWLKQFIIHDSLFLILLPIGIYFLSYLPFFTSGHSLNQWWELQHQMWWYHTRLTATHTYQSSALSWPILARPVWFFVDYQQKAIANIYAMGNPLIWWGGLVSLPFVIWQTLKKRDWQLGLVIFAYLAFFIPWVLSPRIMFIYHYLPSIPFLCLFLGWTLEKFWKKKQSQLLITSYLLLITITSLFFYPHWIGIHVPKWLDNLYYWFPSWK